MQIKGKAEGKSASAHIIDGERLGEARDAVKPSETTTNSGRDELDGERTGCPVLIQSTQANETAMAKLLDTLA